MQENKKPFEQEVRKLQKPGQKPITTNTNTSVPNIVENAGNTTTVPNITGGTTTASTQNKGNSLLDDDILGFSQPAKPAPQPQPQVQHIQQLPQVQPQQVQQALLLQHPQHHHQQFHQLQIILIMIQYYHCLA